MPYQTLSDLINADKMQQAQIGAMGQESQLRQLQMQGAQQDVAQKQQGYDDTRRLRDLMMNASKSPGGVEALLPQLLSGSAGMPGLELGIKLKQLTQKEAYTLKPNEKRFGGDNQLINQNDQPDKFDPNKPFQMVNGVQVPNEAYQAYEQSKSRASAANTTIKLPSTKGYTKLAENDADAISQMSKDATAGARALPAIRALNRNEKGAYSGLFAPGQVAFSQFMSAIGVNDPKLQKALVSSELFNQSSDEYAAMILKPLMGSTQLSNTDLAFVKGIVPRLQNQPEARRELLQYAEQRVNQMQTDYQSARKHYESHDASLTGWNPSQPADIAQTATPKRTISRQEILQTAGKARKTPAQVEKDAIASGYSVEGM